MPSPNLPLDAIASFASASSAKSRSQLLQEEDALQTPEAVQALCDQASRWAREDPSRARQAAEAAVWLAGTLKHLPSQGLARRTLANVFSSLARPTEAFSEYKAALDIFTSLDDDLQAAITRSSALPAVTDTLGIEPAFDWAKTARKVFEARDDHLRLARLENNLAVLRFRQEDFPLALEHWKAANATLQRIGEVSDQAATLRNLAVCSISLNQPQQAKAYYREARQLCKENNFTVRLHAIDYNIAYLHYLEGDQHRALQLYQAARTRSHQLGDTYHEALCSLDETEVYIELNLLHEADTVAKLAATQFKEQHRPYEAAKAVFNLALVHSRLGDSRAALDYLDESAAAFEGQGNILWPGQVELLRASTFFSEGRFYEAARAANAALSRFKQSGLLRRASLAILFLAKINHSRGLLQEAEALCRSALGDLETFGEPASLFQAFFLLGEVLDTKGETATAVEAFSRAEACLMELRQRRAVSQMRISAVEQPLEVYARLVRCLIGDESAPTLSPELFRLVETAKARSFADLMTLSGLPGRAPTSMRSQLVDQVSKLRQELNWLYRRIDRSELPDTAAKPSAVESLQTQSRAKEVELAKALSLLRVRNPDSNFDPERIGIVELEAVRRRLKKSVLVEFFLAQDLVIALVLSQRHQIVVPVAIASTVRDLHRRLWHYLHHSAPGATKSGQSQGSINAILGDLYAELILPIEDYLGDSPLLIAPHGFLFLVPFHALQQGGTHLIERAPVSYVPSAAALCSVTQDEDVEVQRLAVLGRATGVDPNDFFSDAPGELLRTSRQRSKSGPRPKPKAVSGESTATHLLATCHLRTDNPLFSTITIGADQLTLLDLYRLRHFGPVVSIEGAGFSPATPTGGGREISALWAAALASGARALLIPVDYAPAPAHREYARLFYRHLLAGEEIAFACRSAALSMLKRGADIREWAGLSLVGSPHLRLRY